MGGFEWVCMVLLFIKLKKKRSKNHEKIKVQRSKWGRVKVKLGKVGQDGLSSILSWGR